MTLHLDPKLVKVIALMRSTTHAGEKAAAQARAEAMAAVAGITLDEAVAAVDAPVPSLTNFMAGFDDFMEREEPGYKARRASEKAEKERQRLERRAAIISRYGSEEVALAPCERELLLHQALAPWRRPCKPPWERTTAEIDGHNGLMLAKDIPAHLREAVKTAYPWPTTFAAAWQEHRYWIARRDEIEDVLGPNNYGDSGLDLTAELRLELLRPLVEHELSTTSFGDFVDRLRFYHELEFDCPKILDALMRDAEALLAEERLNRHPSKPSTTPAAPHSSTPESRDGRIRAALDADPSRSDRDIARACRCSPTTVGKVRNAMGLAASVRSVRRGGQAFQMRFAFGDSRT